MSNNHYLWPLFTNELSNTKASLARLWSEHKISDLQAAHWALTVGNRRLISEILRSAQSAQEKEQIRQGIKFRIIRTLNYHNPYEKLLKIDNAERDKIITHSLQRGFRLNGGIGDHIEDLTILLPWYEKQRTTARIFCSKSRNKQFGRILRNHTWNHINRNNQDEYIYSSKILMAAINTKLPKPKAIINQKVRKNSTNSVLCCWKASGEADILSCWMRSVKFEEVLNFYKNTIKEYRGKIRIVDCTKWNEQEKEALRMRNIETYEPENGDILDLIQKIEECKYTISIDTALAHLCAATGNEVELLLPLCQDERWNQLLQIGSSYNAYCTVYKQEIYGSWNAVLNNLGITINKKELKSGF